MNEKGKEPRLLFAGNGVLYCARGTAERSDALPRVPGEARRHRVSPAVKEPQRGHSHLFGDAFVKNHKTIVKFVSKKYGLTLAESRDLYYILSVILMKIAIYLIIMA